MKRIAATVIAAFVGLSVVPAGADEGAERLRRAEGLARRAAFHLDAARVERDVRKARCHDGVLSQTNAVIRMLRHRLRRLRDATAAGDAARAAHHASVLGVLDERLDALEASLRACNGERWAAGATGTQVIVIVSPDVPREDPTVVRAPSLRD